MDPNACIREMCELLVKPAETYTYADNDRVIELRAAYRGWRASGGFPASREVLNELECIDEAIYLRSVGE